MTLLGLQVGAFLRYCRSKCARPHGRQRAVSGERRRTWQHRFMSENMMTARVPSTHASWPSSGARVSDARPDPAVCVEQRVCIDQPERLEGETRGVNIHVSALWLCDTFLQHALLGPPPGHVLVTLDLTLRCVWNSVYRSA